MTKQQTLNFTDEVPQSVIDKIRKLQALSEGAAKVNSLAESEAAALAVNKLLTKYNLSLLDIEKNAPEENEASNIIRSDYISVMNTFGRQWKEQLLQVLCKFNYCRVIISSHKVFLLGTDLNTAAVISLYNMLQKAYLHAGKQSYESAKITYKGGKLTQRYMRKYITSYLLGCSIGLNVMLDKIQSQQCRQLVVFHDKHINDYIDKNMSIKTVKRPVKKTIDSAYTRGFMKGMTTELNKHIN